MFYSHFLLSRKGPLHNIWVAAYSLKRLQKDQVFDTDISSSVDDIMVNEFPVITYRVLGYLLLGVVRIYSKKVDYLYDDCHETLIKINSFVVSTKVNPAREALCAPYLSITIPANFELDAFDLEVLEDVSGDNMKPNEEIMLKEAWEDQANEHYSLTKRYHHEELDACFEICSTGCIPVEDAFSPILMDIDMVVSPSHNLSLQPSRENLRGNQLPEEEFQDLDIFCETAERLELDTQFDEVDNHAEQFSNITPMDVRKPLIEFHPIAITPEGSPEKSKFTYTAGASTPEFMAIQTPAKQERPRFSRKRKHFFDDIIVLPNEVLRQNIHDSSNLVCKRREAPHTAFDAWKAHKISNLSQDFLDPLIPFMSLELKALFYKKNFETPEPVAVVGPNKSEEVGFETPSKSSEQKAACQENSVDHSASVRFVEGPTTCGSDEVGPLTLVASIGKEQSPIEACMLGLNLMDEEISPQEEDNEKLDGWAVRTRQVVRYLQKTFLSQKEQSEKDVLNLTLVLEGRTRKESARLFYEILVLKTEGFIDVKQETPYDDILVLTTSELEALS